MTPSPYTEDSLVQQTTADYLEQQLGWESLYAHNCEDFGTESLLGRRDDREVVLTRTLRAKLIELNPGRRGGEGEVGEDFPPRLPRLPENSLSIL